MSTPRSRSVACPPRAWLLLGALACTLGHAGAAAAQSASPTDVAESAESADGERAREYRQAVEGALAEYALEHYEEARTLFTRAHELEPNARTLRGLGMVEFELRHYVRAAELLEEALVSRVKPLTDEQRTSVELLLARTRHFIGRFDLKVQPKIEELTLELDGRRVPFDPEQTLPLEAGEHILRISGPGVEPRELRLDVRGGQHQTLRIELRARDHGAAESAPGSEEVPLPASSRRRTALTLLGTGGALVVASAVVGALGWKGARDATSAESADGDRARTLALVGDIGMGVGLATAVVGLVLRLTERRPVRADGARTHLHGTTLTVRF